MTAITEADRGPHAPFAVRPDLRVVPLQTPTLPPATHTNCVVIGRRRVVVVDPASPYSDEQAQLRAWLDAAGATVGAILLTHHHGDHIAGAAPLREATGAPICAHPATAARLEGQLAIDVALYEGDVLAEALDVALDPGWTALHTPGHARGHLAVRHAGSGALVAGDLVAGQGTIVIDPPDGDMTDYLATLARLVALGTGWIVPAHGPAIQDGDALLLEYIGHRMMREEQLMDALARRPGGARPLDLVPVLYPEIPPMFHPLAARQVLAHLLKLEAEGHVVRPDGSRGVPGRPVYMSGGFGGSDGPMPLFARR